MPLDGITLSSVVREMSDTIIGGRVDKIQQPESDEIIITIRSRGQNHKLLFTANASAPRVHFTEVVKINPEQAPMFCMLLRKHLGGGRIISVNQPNFERIVELYVESPNEMGDLSVKCLLIEIMGKHSNIILLDTAKVIMDSAKHISRAASSVREVLPGRQYTRPPSQGKVSPCLIDDFGNNHDNSTSYDNSNEAHGVRKSGKVNKEHFYGLFDDGEKIGLRIQQLLYQSYNGISPIMASELCERAKIAPDIFPGELSEVERERLFEAFANLYAYVEKGVFDCRIYQNAGKGDFSVVPMTLYASWESSAPFNSPSVMLESFYRQRDNAYRLSQKTADLRKLVASHIERCVKKQTLHEKTLKDIGERDKLRKYGELITAYIYAIPSGSDSFRVQDFYYESTNEGSDEGSNQNSDEGAEITIPLDPTLSAAENAQVYFKRYNKEKRTYTALQEQKETNAVELVYLDSVMASIETVTNEMDIAEIRSELAEQGFLKRKYMIQQSKGKKGQKTQKKSKPLHYRSSEGFDMYVGKNNTQNDELTLRFARPNDIWLHTKEIAGSHVIIKADGKTPPETTIMEAANLAAFHSKGRHSSQVPVDYVQKRHVRKPNGAKPGFVIYDFHKTVYITPTEPISVEG